MKNKIKALVVGGVLSILIIIIGMYTYSKSDIVKYKVLVKQIEDYVLLKKDFDEKLYNELLDKIQVKIDSKQQLSVLENFIVGYHYFLNSDYEKVYEFYSKLQAAENKPVFIKAMTNRQFVRACIILDKDEPILEITRETIMSYSPKDINKYFTLIKLSILQIMDVPGGQELIVELYEDMLTKKEELSPSVLLEVRGDLTAFYLNNSDYGKCLELSLENLAQAQAINHQYQTALSMHNLASIYSQYKNYEAGKYWTKQSLSCQVDDPHYDSHVKSVSILNYLLVLTYNEEYEEVELLLEEIPSYVERLDESIRVNISTTFNVAIANYKIQQKDFVTAGKLLKEAEAEIEDGVITNLSSLYSITYAKYLMETGEKQEAIAVYEQILQEYEGAVVNESLNQLINYYIEIGDTQNIKKYVDQLDEFNELQTQKINDNYMGYAEQKYIYELEMERNNANKVKNTIWIATGVIISMLCIGVLFFRLQLLYKLNKIDGLTQIYNRGYFNRRFEKEREKNSSFYLIMFDIDNFKKLNDTYGHTYGDYVIKHIASITSKKLGKAGTVFRYGGEEFVIMMKNQTQGQVVNKAEEIRQAIADYNWDKGCKITVSMGISYTDNNKDDVLDTADKRLYESKLAGKNKVSYCF